MGEVLSSAKRSIGDRRLVLSSVGLALTFLFRDSNRYTMTLPVEEGSWASDIVLAAFRLLPLVLIAVVYLLVRKNSGFGLIDEGDGPSTLRRALAVVIALVSTCGLVFSFFPSYLPNVPMDAVMVGKAMFGCGNTLLLMMWAWGFLPCERERMLSIFIGASYVYGVLRIALGLFSPIAAFMILAICPAISCYLLYETAAPDEQNADSPRERFSDPLRRDKNLGWSLLLGMACYTFLLAKLHGIWIVEVTDAPQLQQFITQFATGVGVIVGTLLVSRLRPYLLLENPLPYSVLLPSILLVLLYFSTFLPAGLVSLYVVSLMAVQRLCFFLIWNFSWSYRRRELRIGMFCLGMLALEAGVMVYDIVAAANSLFSFGEGVESTALGVVLMVLVAKESFSWYRSFKQRKTVLEVEKQDAATSGLPSESTMKALGDRYGLTPRERDVLPYIISGYTPEHIGILLYIAPTTAKTHIRNIYRKVGVKKRTELRLLASDIEAEENNEQD